MNPPVLGRGGAGSRRACAVGALTAACIGVKTAAMGKTVCIVVIDIPSTRASMKDKSDTFFLRPADIAETAFNLTVQAPSAWSFEVEAGTFGETW